MKADRSRIVKILGSLCCFGILIGIFLPVLSYGDEHLLLWDCLSDIEEHYSSYAEKIGILLCVEIFLILFTYLVIYAHGELTGVGLPVALFVFSLADWLVYKEMSETFWRIVPLGKIWKGIGAHVLGWCFTGLLITGILALVFVIMGKGEEAKESDRTENAESNRDAGESVLVCPECGKPYEKEDTFCGRCGYRFKKIACPKCGKDGDEGDLFCKKCGIHLVEMRIQEETEEEQEKPAENDAISNIEDMHVHSEQGVMPEMLPVTGDVEEKFYTCITCGEKIPVTKHFCTRCGTRVD